MLIDDSLDLQELKIHDQRFEEIFRFKNHEDQGLRCSVIGLCSSLIDHSELGAVSMSILLNGLRDESSQVVCKTVQAIIRIDKDGTLPLEHGELLIRELIRLSGEQNLYFATKIEIIGYFGGVVWRRFDSITWEQEDHVRQFHLSMIKSNDVRLRNAALAVASNLIRELYGPSSIRQKDEKILSKLNMELTNQSSRNRPMRSFDESVEYGIEVITDELLKSISSSHIAGLSSALLILIQSYPSARIWSKLTDHPFPPLIGYLVQVLEMQSSLVEWSSQNSLFLLVAELIKAHVTGDRENRPIKARYFGHLLKSIQILKLVFSEKKLEDRKVSESIASQSVTTTEADQSRSPNLARRFRKMLPGSSNNVETKKSEISELPQKPPENGTNELQDEIIWNEMFEKLNSAFQSSKLKFRIFKNCGL